MGPQSNVNNFFGIRVSKPGVNVNNAGPKDLILSDNYSQRIYYDANGSPTVLLGTRQANPTNGLVSNELGLFVSQPGIDVNIATDGQLIFNSGNDIFTIIAEGSVSCNYTIAFPGSTTFKYAQFVGNSDPLGLEPNVSHEMIAFAEASGGAATGQYPLTQLGQDGGGAGWSWITFTPNYFYEGGFAFTSSVIFDVSVTTFGTGTTISNTANCKFYIVEQTAS